MQSPKNRSQWQRTLSATTCSWREKSDARALPIAPFVGVGTALVALAILTPAVFVAFILIAFISFIKGMKIFSSEVLLDPWLWAPLLGTSVGTGLLVAFLFAQKRIVAFAFHADARQFEYVEKRFLLAPLTHRLTFESIVDVVPTLLTSYAVAGHFQVTVKMPNGRTKSLWLGDDVALETLTQHSEWLSTHLGTRVHPALRFDT